jgi:hypothetical protein
MQRERGNEQESSVKDGNSKEWQIGVLRNIEQNMDKSERKRCYNWVIVRDYFLMHTNKGGSTSAYLHCEWLGVDPDEFTFY